MADIRRISAQFGLTPNRRLRLSCIDAAASVEVRWAASELIEAHFP
jgi:hypothetical protein